MNQHFVRTLEIGKNTATAAITAGVVPTDNLLIEGDVVCTNAKNGKTITSLTGVDEVVIIQKANGTIFRSNVIKVASLTNAKKVAYVAPVLARKAIGYDGVTSGSSFPVVNDTTYNVGVDYWFRKDRSNDVKGDQLSGNAKPRAAAKQFQILKDISYNFNFNSVFGKGFVYSAPIVAVMPTTGTGITAIPVGAGNAVFVKGSPVITFATSATLSTIIAGDNLLIKDGTSSFAGTATYKVKAVFATSNQIMLESPYIGASETMVTTDFATKFKILKETAVAGITADAGILFEATDTSANYRKGFKQYDLVDFTITGGRNTSAETTITTLASPKLGSGLGYLVADLEEVYRGNTTPYVTRQDVYSEISEQAVLTETYDIWEFATLNKDHIDGIAYSEAPIQTTVALPVTRTAGKTSTAAATLMDAIVAL